MDNEHPRSKEEEALGQVPVRPRRLSVSDRELVFLVATILSTTFLVFAGLVLVKNEEMLRSRSILPTDVSPGTPERVTHTLPPEESAKYIHDVDMLVLQYLGKPTTSAMIISTSTLPE